MKNTIQILKLFRKLLPGNAISFGSYLALSVAAGLLAALLIAIPVR